MEEKDYVIYGFKDKDKISVIHIVHNDSYLGTKKEKDLNIKPDFFIN